MTWKMEVPSHFLWLFACLGDFVLLSKVFINDFPMETSIDTFYYRGYIHSYPTQLDYHELFIKKSWIIMTYHWIIHELSWIIHWKFMNYHPMSHEYLNLPLISHGSPGSSNKPPWDSRGRGGCGQRAARCLSRIYVSHGIIRNYV